MDSAVPIQSTEFPIGWTGFVHGRDCARIHGRGMDCGSGSTEPICTASATRSIAKNSAAPMALSLFNKAIDFVFAAYYLRVLGPADAGSFATAIATAGIFEIIANYGLNILLIREVSQDRSRAGHFLFNSSLLRLGIAARRQPANLLLHLGDIAAALIRCRRPRSSPLS